MSDGDSPHAPLLDHWRLVWHAEEENARRLGLRVNIQLTVIAGFLGFGVFRLLSESAGTSGEVWVRLPAVLGLALLAWAALHLLGMSDGWGTVWPSGRLREVPGKIREDIRVIEAWRGRVVHVARLLSAIPFFAIAAIVGAALWLVLFPFRPVGRREAPAFASHALQLSPETYASLPEPPETASRDYGVFLAAERLQEAATELATLNYEESRRIDRGQQFVILGVGFLVVAVVVHALTASPTTPPEGVSGTLIQNYGIVESSGGANGQDEDQQQGESVGDSVGAPAEEPAPPGDG